MLSKAKIIWYTLIFICIYGITALLIILSEPLKQYVVTDVTKEKN